jgi:hypothetical protein
VRTCQKFLVAVLRQSLAMWDNIVTMDESAVSFPRTGTKQQSKHWLPKDQPDPITAKVQASQTKQMVLAFFDSKGIIYTNYNAEGDYDGCQLHSGDPGQVHEIFWKKRPVIAEGEWFFYWDNAPVHTAALIQDLLAARQVQMTCPPPTSSSSPSSRCRSSSRPLRTAGRGHQDLVQRVLCHHLPAMLRAYEKCVQINGNYCMLRKSRKYIF